MIYSIFLCHTCPTKSISVAKQSHLAEACFLLLSSCPVLKSYLAPNQSLLRSKLVLFLLALQSCRDCWVEPPEKSHKDGDQYPDQSKYHPQGAPPILLLLLVELLLAAYHLHAGVEVVLDAED